MLMFHEDTCLPVFSWPHKKTCQGTKAEAFRFLPSSTVIDRQLGTTRLLVHRQPAAILSTILLQLTLSFDSISLVGLR